MKHPWKTALHAARPAATAAGAGALLAGAAAFAAALYVAGRRLTRRVPQGAVVVITGASRGLGFALASRFAQAGRVKLVLAARDRPELERAQVSLLERHAHLEPADLHLVAADLTVRSECQRLVAEAFARFGRIDILVNNAGVIQVGPIEHQSLQTFDDALSLMYRAALDTTWAALPRLRTQRPLPGWSRRAALVNIASIGGKVAVPHLLPYSAAKFAIVGFSEGLHAELKHTGIHVLTVCPGLMRTGGEDHALFVGQKDKEAAWFRFGAKTPGLSSSVHHAAGKIVRSLEAGRAEITITPQAWLAARFAGLCPETTQWFAALANRFILPGPAQPPAPQEANAASTQPSVS
ncbi:MAG: SDR family NAD(P)-dependent oxidoreductase [Acidobacteriota bacterium]|nr:SDR family NAD(P)-dependent oxidoreductase [Acidobacteriota bacterium]